MLSLELERRGQQPCLPLLRKASIGKWWDDEALDDRHWILLSIRPTPTDFGMRIDAPEDSSHANFKPLGIALSRAEALESPLRDQFFEVADLVVENDPAVNS